MTTTHEAGHIFCGLACGGTLRSASLLPWELPYSLFDPDPHPLVTLWGGPVLGIVIPVAIAWVAKQAWTWFIAYFCILSNGLYLAVAWIAGDRFLDTSQLLEHGAHPVSIAVFSIATIGWGYIGFRQKCAELLLLSRSAICPQGTHRRKHIADRKSSPHP